MSEQLVVTYPSSDTSVRGVKNNTYFNYAYRTMIKTDIPYFATINSITFDYSFKYSSAMTQTIYAYLDYYTSQNSSTTSLVGVNTKPSTSYAATTYYTHSFTSTNSNCFGNKTIRAGNNIHRFALRSTKASSNTSYFYFHLNSVTYNYEPFLYNILLFSQREGGSATSITTLPDRNLFYGSLIDNDSKIEFYVAPTAFQSGSKVYEVTDGTNTYIPDSNNKVVIPVSSDLNITFKYRDIQYTVNRHVFDLNGIETVYPKIVNYSDSFTLLDGITEEIGTTINNTFINYSPTATLESDIPGFEYPTTNITFNQAYSLTMLNNVYIIKVIINSLYPGKLKFYYTSNDYNNNHKAYLYDKSLLKIKTLTKYNNSSVSRFFEYDENIISLSSGKYFYYLVLQGNSSYVLGWKIVYEPDTEYFESRISKKLFGWYATAQTVTDWYLTGTSTLNNGNNPYYSLTDLVSQLTATEGATLNYYAYYIPAVCYINYAWLDSYGIEDEYKLENYIIKYGGNHTIPNIPTYSGHYTVEHGGTDEWYKFTNNDITTTEIVNLDSILTNITQDYIFFGRKIPLARTVSIQSNDTDFGNVEYAPIKLNYVEGDTIIMYASSTNIGYFDNWVNNNVSLKTDWPYNNYIAFVGSDNLNITGLFRSNQVYTKGGSS